MSDHKLQEIVTKSKNFLESLKLILQQAQQKMGFQFGAIGSPDLFFPRGGSRGVNLCLVLGVPKETISFFDIICMHFVWLGMGLHAMMLIMLSSKPLGGPCATGPSTLNLLQCHPCHCHWSELNFRFLLKNTIANFLLKD